SARSKNMRKNCGDALSSRRGCRPTLSNIFFLFPCISFILHPGAREPQSSLRPRFARDTSERSRLLVFPNQIVSRSNVLCVLPFALLISLAACKPASNDQGAKDQAPKDQAPNDQAITYTADPNA